jgi:osmotically-inducible protein OsmY
MRSDPSIPRSEREEQAAAMRRLRAESPPQRDDLADPVAGRFPEPRSWWARTSDEVASWFGNTEAMRRRQWDEAAGDQTGKGPVRQIDDDVRIQEEVVRRLTVDSQVDASKMEVAVAERVVTLSGVVKTLAEATRAEQIALATPRIASVDNALTVA